MQKNFANLRRQNHARFTPESLLYCDAWVCDVRFGCETSPTCHRIRGRGLRSVQLDERNPLRGIKHAQIHVLDLLPPPITDAEQGSSECQRLQLTEVLYSAVRRCWIWVNDHEAARFRCLGSLCGG